MIILSNIAWIIPIYGALAIGSDILFRRVWRDHISRGITWEELEAYIEATDTTGIY